MISIEGKLVLENEVREGRVEIDPATGLITRVAPGELTGQADLTTDALVFPGFGDLHVHAREDAGGSQTYKEDFLTCSEAAINGGVAFMADMPNNPVAPVDEERYAAKEALARKSLVDTVLYAGIGPDTLPLKRKVPYKIFMGPSVGDLFFTSRASIEKALERYRDETVNFHSEEPEILEAHKGAASHESRRPPEAEVEAIEFAINLIEKFDLRGKICHLSTAAGLELIRKAKTRGVAITAEVTPHHLYFDETMLTPENRLWLQMNPPLRAPRDREAMIEGLRDGSIDYLATDHAPHTKEEKLAGVSGVPHLDTYGAFTAWLMSERGFSSLEVARAASVNPGVFIKPYLPPGSGEGFGKIAQGYIGSLTVIDTAAPRVIKESDLKTKCHWSPFTGIEFPGKVRATIIRGKIYPPAPTP
jgi:dihydroorotase